MARKRPALIDDENSDFDASGFHSEPQESPAVQAPRPASQAIAPTSAQPAAADALPDNLGDAIALLTRLDNTDPPQTREGQKALRNQLTRVKRHVYALQQMPPAPVIDANAQAESRTASANTVKARASRIAALKARLGI